MAVPVSVVVMAAGKGTRMKSERPKVLHRIAGRAMLSHVLGTVEQLTAANDLQKVVVITGHGAEVVEAHLASPNGPANLPLEFARQMPQLGTGHAVQQAVPYLPDDGVVVILNGDVPLIQADTVQALIQASAGQHLALLTVQLADPTGYGRIVRQGAAAQGAVLAIVEHKDPIGIAQGTEAMSDRQRRSSTYQHFQCVLDRLFRLGVDTAGRLVEDQHLGIV